MNEMEDFCRAEVRVPIGILDGAFPGGNGLLFGENFLKFFSVDNHIPKVLLYDRWVKKTFTSAKNNDPHSFAVSARLADAAPDAMAHRGTGVQQLGPLDCLFSAEVFQERKRA